LEAAGVRVVTIPEAGHNIMLDTPTAFAEEVARL
jgi:pimeloyl-ACP methyl ester carboxylesterase